MIVLTEAFARFSGTPVFIVCQTIVVAVWIGPLSAAALTVRWDPIPSSFSTWHSHCRRPMPRH